MKTVSVASLAVVAICILFQPVLAAHSGTRTEKILHGFCSERNCTDGEYPSSGLIDVNGKFYGTTSLGGTNNGGWGTVFAIDPKTGKEKVVYSFCGQLQGYSCLDGAMPRGGLIDVDGKLYGTTQQGGNSGCGGRGCGTVFSVDPVTGVEAVLHNFGGGADGSNPESSLIVVNGVLYGTTFNGGAGCGNDGCGTVFSLDPGTGAETVVHSFGSLSFASGPDGAQPVAGLIDVNGLLYGVTSSGGTYHGGAIFSIDPGSGAETVLHSFCPDIEFGCTDGWDPETALINMNGILYGTTNIGADNATCNNVEYVGGCGAVYSFDPSTGTETVIHAFCEDQYCSDGEYPQGNLISMNGLLYGTTYLGGQQSGCCGSGIVFSLDPGAKVEKLIYSFGSGGGADGRQPVSGLLAVKGVLYGTTLFGGGNKNAGAVFELGKH